MITFASTEVEMPSLSRFDYCDWIERVAKIHGRVLDYNRRFLGHDYFTDVITFDDDEGETINGDIIISLDTVKSNSEELGVSYEEEFDRVVIHGILHLCGINDKGPGEREIMEAAENAALEIR